MSRGFHGEGREIMCRRGTEKWQGNPREIKSSKILRSKTKEVRDYFDLLEELLDEVSSPEPALAYCFQRIEAAQRVGLYALLMREFRTDSQLTWRTVDKLDITRRNFPEFYKNVLGKRLPNSLRDLIEPAEKIRDDITHGRHQSAAEVQRAILSCLKFAEALNKTFREQAGFNPIGPLRGVTSKKRPQLDKRITAVVLRGLGLTA